MPQNNCVPSSHTVELLRRPKTAGAGTKEFLCLVVLQLGRLYLQTDGKNAEFRGWPGSARTDWALQLWFTSYI